MRIGIGLPNQVRDVRPAVIPKWAVRAEQAGFSSLSTVGRIAYPGVTDTVALAGAAGATSTIELVSTVLLATVWPPALLAKEIAGIDGISGGRLTLGVGVGGRADDFVADGHGMAGRGKRFDWDLDIYREIWSGRPYAGGDNPAVPRGTREVPLLFGGSSPAAFERMARRGVGYIAPSVPPEAVAGMFDMATGRLAGSRAAGRAAAGRHQLLRRRRRRSRAPQCPRLLPQFRKRGGGRDRGRPARQQGLDPRCGQGLPGRRGRRAHLQPRSG